MRVFARPVLLSPRALRIIGVLFLVMARRPARATTYVVDRVDDDATKSACTAAANDCTLRGAVIAANGHAGADVIDLPAGTYDLTVANPSNTHEDAAATGDLDVTGDLTIMGAGAATTIVDGQQHDRVFHGNPGEQNATITIQDLTIRNGHSPQIAFVNAEGGGVRNGATSPSGTNPVGTLHLLRVIVDGNSSDKHGGGIANDGTMTIADSVVSNNVAGLGTGGGGIVQDDEGTLSITDTTIVGNQAETGGGAGGALFMGFFSIGSNPAVTIDGTTISGNTARTGGGIGRNRGTITLTNSTISGNTATQTSGGGGGGISDSGAGPSPMLLVNCTVTNNTASATSSGGGIQNNGATSGAETKLANTIVAGNHASSGVDIAGTLQSGGYNLIGVAAGFSVDGPHSDTTGDQVGVANPHLGVLADNGGATQTHALLAGSPAIDGGNPAASDGGGVHCRATDQLGTARPVDGDGSGSARCDVGAFEVATVPTTPTPTTTSTPTPTVTPTPTRTVTPTVTATVTIVATASPTTAVPTATATPSGSEICDNCVDDDGDDLVDRADPDCDQPLDGAGQGIGDVVRAKRLVKCAGALQKSGAKVTSTRFARLQKCLDAVFACTQLKNGDAKCLAKAKAGCDKALAALPSADAKLAAALAKACGPTVVDANDLRVAAGLAYDGHAARCTDVGAAPVTDAGTLATCVAREHACRTDAAVAVAVPRAAELLTLVGHDASELPCLPTGTGTGAGLGDAGRGKRANKCEQAIKKAGAKLVSGEMKLVPKCANAVLACAELAKKGCAEKSRATCGKTQGKVDGLAAKLAAAVRKACVASGLALADATSADGIGFDALAASCAAARTPGFSTFDDVIACVTTYHQCRAHQLLESEYPRLRELLGTGQLVLP